MESVSDPCEGSASPSVDIQKLFQAEIYAILACGYVIQTTIRSEKCISISSHSQAALKVLQAVKTMSPLVRKCQRVLDDVAAHYSVRLIWVSGYSGVK
jgi:hypothetical protein